MSQRPRKLQRISRACDLCNRRSVKCSPCEDSLGRCQNCADFDVPCTFDRPIKRRGVKARSSRSAGHVGKQPSTGGIDRQEDTSPGLTTTGSLQESRFSDLISDQRGGLSPVWSDTDEKDERAVRNSWKAFAIASDRTIKDLVQVFFEIVYPIFPLFHRPSFLDKILNHSHLRDRGLFASTMAACALASTRARDGALYTNGWRLSQLAEPPAEAFCAAARDSIPRNLALARGIDYMRACAILAITGIQNGQIKMMQQYSGMYHTLLSMEGLYDEKLWPKNLSPIETEERRRLFWSIYTLDVYSSIVWGGIVRYREAHSLVRYPSEVDDEFITPSGYGVPQITPTSSYTGPAHNEVSVISREPASWLRGWNFTTDLYRILEHAVDHLRRSHSHGNGTTRIWHLFGPSSISESTVMDQVLAMYASLPAQFRETLPVTGNPSKDLFGFQSANIQATLQLLRMVLFSAEDRGVERKCDVAGELLSVFSTVPVEYLKAISSPLLYHLGGIGSILGSVMECSLSEASYYRMRKLLLELADLLHLLESGLHRAAGASEKLKSQVERIDEYMRTQRIFSILPQSHGPATGRPKSAVPLHGSREPSNGVLGPSMYDSEACATRTTAANRTTGFGDQMYLFQLPQELLDDWPWPFDPMQFDGLLPPGCE